MGAKEVLLSRDTASEIENPGERTFAQAVTSIDHLTVTYQVPVGEKVIDFRVKNEKVNGGGDGKLVEVSGMTQRKAEKLSEENKLNKDRQSQAAEQSGQSLTVLYGENLEKIQQSHGE